MPGTTPALSLTMPRHVLVPVAIIVLALPALVVAAAVFQP